MSLQDWAKNDWLKAHTPSKQELQGLLSIVERELRDSAVDGLSADGRFNHAFRAALTLATVLLHASGYASARGQSHHYRTIEAIPEILGAGAKDDAAYLQACRVKRNAAEYDAANEASDTEATELIRFAKELEGTVRSWCGETGSDAIAQTNHRAKRPWADLSVNCALRRQNRG
jgi:hypothetical protein